MRISLLAEAILYPLAGEDGVSEQVHSGAGDFVVEAAAAVQERQRLRAARAASMDRGNRQTTLTFSTTRLFASPAEAELYCLDYDLTAPRSGMLVIADTGATTYYMIDAVVDPPARRTIGATALLEYSVTGRELTTV